MKVSQNLKDLARNTARIIVVMWRRYPGLMLGNVLETAVSAVTPFVRSGASALLINDLVRALTSGQHELTERELWYVAILVGSTIAQQWLNSVGAYISNRLYVLVVQWADLSIIRQNGDLDVARHEDREFADLANRVLENGSGRIGNFFRRLFGIADDLFGVVLACVVLGWSQWVLLLVIVVATIPELLAESRYGERVWGIWNAKGEVRRRYNDLREHFYRLNKLVELKLFQNTEHFFGMIRDLYTGFQENVEAAEQSKMRQRMLTKTISQTAVGFATAFYVVQVVHGDLQIGTFTFLLGAIAQLRGSLSSFFSLLGLQFGDSLFVADLFKFLDAEPVIIRPTKSIRLESESTPDIEFQNVTFTYPSSSEPVFKDFSLKIPAGRRMAIVGVNGAGKTTLIKLLCRFYDPQKGRILVGGHDLRELDLESWYHMIGALFQDYARYHFFVRDAIAVGRTGGESDMEKVQAVAKAAEADVFIGEWEKSYEQQLGKNFTEGVEPSVGQWQKLGLARTFYRDPRVLILDEPTSSIDAEAEAKIFESIEALPKDRTTIMISHRFSTVRRSDEIVVLDGGRLLEQGSHDKLMAADGTYARLFRLQAKGYEE